jgi:hypothetical protein
MTVDRIFFGYMALAGLAAGAILVAAPEAQGFFIKPYFWVVLAIMLFDVAAYLLQRNAPGTMLTMTKPMPKPTAPIRSSDRMAKSSAQIPTQTSVSSCSGKVISTRIDR